MNWWWLVLTATVVGIAPAPAQQVPIPNGTLRGGRLSFDGHATVGDFTGVTTTVTGELVGAPDLSGVRGWITAPVVSLLTGKDRRDRDLNKSMESETYPELRFELTGVDSASGREDSLTAILRGRLVLHGVTRAVSLPSLLSFRPDGVRVRSTFPLNVRDYEISGLTKMLGVLRMSENIEVHVDVDFVYRP